MNDFECLTETDFLKTRFFFGSLLQRSKLVNLGEFGSLSRRDSDSWIQRNSTGLWTSLETYPETSTDKICLIFVVLILFFTLTLLQPEKYGCIEMYHVSGCFINSTEHYSG